MSCETIADKDGAKGSGVTAEPGLASGDAAG
jgi:hypothetical protein